MLLHFDITRAITDFLISIVHFTTFILIKAKFLTTKKEYMREPGASQEVKYV